MHLKPPAVLLEFRALGRYMMAHLAAYDEMYATHCSSAVFVQAPSDVRRRDSHSARSYTSLPVPFGGRMEAQADEHDSTPGTGIFQLLWRCAVLGALFAVTAWIVASSIAPDWLFFR